MKIIDRSKATLPIGYSLYSVRLTYGREFNALVSANNEREAKDIVKNVYDYLHPKILSVKFVNDNHELIHDLTRELIFGKLNIIEKENDMEIKFNIHLTDEMYITSSIIVNETDDLSHDSIERKIEKAFLKWVDDNMWWEII